MFHDFDWDLVAVLNYISPCKRHVFELTLGASRDAFHFFCSHFDGVTEVLFPHDGWRSHSMRKEEVLSHLLSHSILFTLFIKHFPLRPLLSIVFVEVGFRVDFRRSLGSACLPEARAHFPKQRLVIEPKLRFSLVLAIFKLAKNYIISYYANYKNSKDK